MTLIAQLTDLHVRPPGVPAYRVVETNMLAERAVRRVAALHPAPNAVIITGDLTDCGLASEYALLAGMLARLPMPVHAVPGNHDRREVMAEHLPGTQMHDGFIQYAAMAGDVRLVMLDTVVPGAGHGALCQRRLDWLDATLAADTASPTMIGMHHPPFACGIHMDAIALRDPARFAAIIARHPQVMRVTCGHHHRPVTGQVAHAIAMIVPGTAHQVELDLSASPEAIILEPAAFALHRWTAADGFASHTALVESYPGPFPFVAEPDYPGRA